MSMIADIARGDQLILRTIRYVEEPFTPDTVYTTDDFISLQAHHLTRYAIVLDVDAAVSAQPDQTKVVLRWLQNGVEIGDPHEATLAVLSLQGWQHADHDEIGYWRNVMQALDDGKLVGIGRGKRYRSAALPR